MITNPLLLSSVSHYTAAYDCSALGSGLGGGASAVWPTASKAFYVPLRLAGAYPIARVWVANGAAVSGNFDLGVYDSNGSRVFSIGSTAQAGTSVLQFVAQSVTLAAAGYFLGLAFDNTTAQAIRFSGLTAAQVKSSGLLEQAAAFPLPATMTPVLSGTQYWPLFGITTTASGF